MKRWAFLTVGLYILILAALVAPLAALAFGKWWGSANGPNFADILTGYRDGSIWIWVGIMGLGAGLLLLVPVRVAERRPQARRKVIVPIITAGFFLTCLLLTGTYGLLSAIYGDKMPNIFNFYNFLGGVPEDSPVMERNLWLGFVSVVTVCWTVWGALFYRASKADDPEALTARATRWLLRGSILELLVAVPSHIIVRHRHDCCAPMLSFWGITTGVAVMLACFGPGVFFLFVERMRRVRPKPPAAPPGSPDPAPQVV